MSQLLKVAAAAAGLSLAGPALAIEPITFAQFFQTSTAKVVQYDRSGGMTTLTVTNAPVIFNTLAFGDNNIYNTTFNLSATSMAPVLPTVTGGFVQNGFSGQLSFTNGQNWLTANFSDAKLTIFEGGGSGSFGATMPPSMIEYSSDVLNLENLILADFALAFSGISPAFTATSSSFSANVTGTFAGAIPEPATWALLIAGFGLVGVAARRRRTTAVTAQ